MLRLLGGYCLVVVNSGFHGCCMSGAMRVIKAPPMGGKGPSLYGWEYSMSGR